jgi:hypothetical protein
MSLDANALYALLPAYHRRRDAELGYPLQALCEIFVREGAHRVDMDLDDYADALFVETCAEALLPRIGALVGAEILRPLPPEAGVSVRAFIGNVLRYRRAKGTAIALEMLARDVTGYAAKAVEYFQHLSVTQTVRVPRPERTATASLRDPDGRARHGSAFDANPRTPDMRSISRARGRYNISNVGVHLWRLEAIPYAAPDRPTATAEQLAAVPSALPWGTHAGHFALLPYGRAVPLFQTGHNEERTSPAAAQVPARLRRLPLWHELEQWRAALARNPEAKVVRQWSAPGHEPFTLFVRRTGQADFARVPPPQVMIGTLEPDGSVPTPPWTRPPATQPYNKSPTQSVDLDVAVVVDPATGRMVFSLPNGQPDVAEVRVAHALGQPGALGGGAYDRNDSEAPFKVVPGSVVYLVGVGTEPPSARRFPAVGAALDAWAANGAGKHGFIVVTENLVDAVDAAQPLLEFVMPPGSDLTVVAAEWRVPAPDTSDALGFIVRQSRRLMLLRPLVIKTPAGGAPARLTLDGVYADQGVKIEAGALAMLEIRHCTLLPTQATALDLHGAPAAPLATCLYRSITGRIAADEHVGALRLKDCIVARHPAQPSIAARASDVELERVTLFGALAAKTLLASNSILLGLAEAERRQQGCVRYSFLGQAADHLPRRYRCQPGLAQEARAAQLQRALTADEALMVALSVRPLFIDTEPEQPAFAQLAMDAPSAILFGGEGETEMGAWGFLGGPTRLANLTDLFNDYMPFGLEAGALRADLSGTEAQRRNVP